MINKNLLRYHYSEAGYNVVTLAEELGMNQATLSRKINGISDFNRVDIIKLTEVLNLTPEQVMKIFFE